MYIDFSFSEAVILFCVSALCLYYFSDKLSNIVNIIDDSFNLGDAFGGTILLSVVTNLPEVAITISAAYKGTPDIAIGNIMGSVLIQTVLLVVFDAAASKKEIKPLSELLRSRTALIQLICLAVLLCLVILGASGNFDLLWWGHVSPIEVCILLLWLYALWRVGRLEKKTSPRAAFLTKVPYAPRAKTILFLVLIAIVVFVFGVLLDITSTIIIEHYHIQGFVFGASVLALTTALPELSGGLAFVRQKRYTPIVGDIFGGNAFLMLFFIPLTFLTGRSAIASFSSLHIYVTCFALLMTLVYVGTMLLSPHRRLACLGIDSWVILVLYAACLVGMVYW